MIDPAQRTRTNLPMHPLVAGCFNPQANRIRVENNLEWKTSSVEAPERFSKPGPRASGNVRHAHLQSDAKRWVDDVSPVLLY
jgi:hypothetical protein